MQAFIETHNVYILEQLGLIMRNSLMGAIYRKTLKLNAEALNAASTGKIVTLMSNDAQKVQV
jgi:ATP-binding cassette, subfamily C (CFTR/MRP), member 1